LENKAPQFETNINGAGCVAIVQPHLDNAAGKDKILTIPSNGMQKGVVVKIIKNAGNKTGPIN
jgi:hypothetical protein